MSEVIVKSPDKDKNGKARKVTVEYEFPATIAEAITQYGEGIVFNRFHRQISQELRASCIRAMTTALKNKKPLQAAATAAAATFAPEVNSHASRAVKTIDKALENLSDEERALVMKALSTVESDTTSDPLASA